MALTTGDVFTYGVNTVSTADVTVGADGRFYVTYRVDLTNIAVDVFDPGTNTWSNYASFTTAQFGTTRFFPGLDIAATSDGHLHVALVFDDGDATPPFNELRGVGYGEFDGSTWSFARVEQVSDPNGFRNLTEPRLSIDASGDAHVVYRSDDAGTGLRSVRSATNASGSFVSEVRAQYARSTQGPIPASTRFRGRSTPSARTARSTSPI